MIDWFIASVGKGQCTGKCGNERSWILNIFVIFWGVLIDWFGWLISTRLLSGGCDSLVKVLEARIWLIDWLVYSRFVSGGCDSLVKVWKQGDDGHWTEEAKLEAHSDWVRFKPLLFKNVTISLKLVAVQN